jgi:hypothetical protein
MKSCEAKLKYTAMAEMKQLVHGSQTSSAIAKLHPLMYLASYRYASN